MRHLISITLIKIKEIIECFYIYIWKHHNLPKSLISDRDIQFIFNIWQHLYQMLKINIKLFTVYHSEMNKQIKRVNTVIKHYLWTFVNYMQDNWVKWFSDTKFSVNNAPSSIILTSSFLINFRQNLCLRFEFSESLPAELTT